MVHPKVKPTVTRTTPITIDVVMCVLLIFFKGAKLSCERLEVCANSVKDLVARLLRESPFLFPV
ncbi:hypothetical protein TPADAL_1017a [Treponema pallidum subsp. pallidum DAL-1]|nr:hypothetical protein TPESAMD_1017a [Treponema pallidum subsp. pertenue str. SamoaD]AEZ59229.1 hypothetical protein TPECDC2_1017a [Treponema pallidum subsp. pertenue str. CDC2]AEZ60297.1 hypothetical protein TPEGAU_1017a [Treponema pallidum subsp. pertenue str. Gauthier]AEZ61356.1 hypothetical protein TPADAL_1017a [Treponema pallidum subsp. pallidum DAL-1]AGK84680.1 hypothetical protein TPFB_1017a [Treponema pallidum str. Fribourg-Blanc]AJB41057.1 hypothetical protein TENDBA_1017a [Treponema